MAEHEMKEGGKEARFGMWKSWSSWSSPVGLGIFFLTTALAIAILLYTLLSTIGALFFARSSSSDISAQEMQQLEQQPTGATAGSATGQ